MTHPDQQTARQKALDWARCLIKFHVPETACVTIGDEQKSATDIFKMIIAALQVEAPVTASDVDEREIDIPMLLYWRNKGPSGDNDLVETHPAVWRRLIDMAMASLKPQPPTDVSEDEREQYWQYNMADAPRDGRVFIVKDKFGEILNATYGQHGLQGYPIAHSIQPNAWRYRQITRTTPARVVSKEDAEAALNDFNERYPAEHDHMMDEIYTPTRKTIRALLTAAAKGD